jgi:alpha-galactosidase
MTSRRAFVLVGLMALLPASAPASAEALDDGLARTPPMGWNSWNKFQCNVSEALVEQMADAIVGSGLRDAGYVYVNVDDCWQGARDGQGFIQPDATRFPSGMKALASYLHGRGLKFGIYSDAGTMTCAKRPGSHGFEGKDAQRYASWDVDYVKYDWCNTDGIKPEQAYASMRDALARAGRPIVLSICEWGQSQPWTWAAPVGHLWRTTGDIGICWEKKSCGVKWQTGITNILDLQVGLDAYAGPGHWNDPDMLQVGNGLTDVEDRTHFSMWAILAAPLLAGNDVRHMSDATRETLGNREVIAVDQDALGVQGHKVRDDGAEEVWAKPLSGGAMAVTLLNRGEGPVRIQVAWSELGWRARSVAVRDLWRREDEGWFRERYSAEVAPHGVIMLRLAPQALSSATRQTAH